MMVTPPVAFRRPSDGESFLVTAKQLWQGAKALEASTVETHLPGALLAAQALEGALKALLWSAKIPASKLSKKPFGHDLSALWGAAAKLALVAPTSPPDWCVLLNTLHDWPYRGRYPQGLNGFVTPNPAQLIGAVEQVLLLAENAVKAASFGTIANPDAARSGLFASTASTLETPRPDENRVDQVFQSNRGT
ncbi:hypothetical protein [Pandoraea apista]|uniref:hypothetical protein n=1 Tax=Pandoraea apista TaxID=93218 RepID=UPI00065DCD71|nr:hypothetical protein [Pandoraea apista]ALS68363.1 hypothetical protein AT395_24770 [Pandoraea apista]ALS68425.1 hypothetical protein AT395_25120 [Pandoraea apista]